MSNIFEVFKSQLVSEKVYNYWYDEDSFNNEYYFETDSGNDYKVSFIDRGPVDIIDVDFRMLIETSDFDDKKKKYYRLLKKKNDFLMDLTLPLQEIITTDEGGWRDSKETRSILIDTRLHILKNHMNNEDVPLVLSYPASDSHEKLYKRSFRIDFRNEPYFHFVECKKRYGFFIINFKSKILNDLLDLKFNL